MLCVDTSKYRRTVYFLKIMRARACTHAHARSRRNKVNYLRNSSLNGNEYAAATAAAAAAAVVVVV